MNSVHEPGSRTMSKNRLRNNTESIRIENRPSTPSAQPKASPHAQAARLLRACRALPRACRALPRACRACHALPRPAARASAPAPAARPASRACAPAAGPTPLAHAPAAPSAHAPCHNTILYCDTILPPTALPATIQYSLSIQLIPHLCNTNQYIAIQSLPFKPF